MERRYFVVMVLSVLLLAGSQIVQAQEAPGDVNATDEVSKPIDAGNKICPVTGAKIDEKSKATYEYKGKIYNLCCPMCIDEFKKDPDKYIKKIGEEFKKASEAKLEQPMMMPDPGMMDMKDNDIQRRDN
jgi:YHS domain-containing protein